MISGARTVDECGAMAMLVGELNARISAFLARRHTATPIGKLGLRLTETNMKAATLKITEIIVLSPADISREIKVGDYLLSVDGRQIDGGRTGRIAGNKVDKRGEIEVSTDAGGSNKKKAPQTVTPARRKNLLYRHGLKPTASMSNESATDGSVCSLA